jgi:hypothetical protein
MSDRDLDKSGYGFQRVRTYLGPSLGWIDELVKPESHVTTGGIYSVLPGESVILVDVASAVQINLPDARLWVGQTAGRPATALEKSITVKDLGLNAANFNIVITPFQGQTIDSVQQAIVISDAGGTAKLLPLIDMTGWILETTGGGGGGGGGGDVFKAGNNTFTGTNTFQGPITVPQVATNDDSQNAATTGWVNLHGFITGAALTPYALLASPTFTGSPKAPTPTPSSDNTTNIATTAFVQAAVAAVAGGAPADAPYITFGTNPVLTGERVLTDSATIGWDFTVPGQAKANSTAGGGNVSTSGTITIGQYAKWATATTIQSVPSATVLTDIGAQPADPTLTGLAAMVGGVGDVPYFSGVDTFSLQGSTSFGRGILAQANAGAMRGYMTAQLQDGDLDAIAALTGTNTIYYRSGTNLWSPVTFSGLTFSGGVLTASAGGTGNVSNSGTPAAGQVAEWTDATHVQGVSTYAKLNSPAFIGLPSVPTPATADNSIAIANTAFVKNQGYAPLADPVFTGDPRAPTPLTSDNDTSIATTAFVKAQGYLSPAVTATLTVGYNFTAFNAGTKSSGTFTPDPTVGNYQYYTNSGAHTLAAPTVDCAIDIMVTNGATAGAITFTSFTVASGNTGDALTTVNTSKFLISIRRINAIATYIIKALQ